MIIRSIVWYIGKGRLLITISVLLLRSLQICDIYRHKIWPDESIFFKILLFYEEKHFKTVIVTKWQMEKFWEARSNDSLFCPFFTWFSEVCNHHPIQDSTRHNQILLKSWCYSVTNLDSSGSCFQIYSVYDVTQ